VDDKVLLLVWCIAKMGILGAITNSDCLFQIHIGFGKYIVEGKR